MGENENYNNFDEIESDESDIIEDESKQELFQNAILNLKNFNDLILFFSQMQFGLKKIRLLLLTTELSTIENVIAEFSQVFTITSLGDLYRIENHKESKSVHFISFLLYSEKNSKIILFTFNTFKQIQKHLLSPFLNGNRKITSLWLTQNLTFDFINYIVSNNLGILTHWYGDYHHSSLRKSRIRPDIDRNIKYRGSDAFSSLLEMRENYGVNVEFLSIQDRNGILFSLNRKAATISIAMRFGKIEPTLGLIDWIFEKTEVYMNQIKDFKKIFYPSIALDLRYELSNVLSIDYKEPLNDEILTKIFSLIRGENRIIIDRITKEEVKENWIYTLKLRNAFAKGSFEIAISKYSLTIYQIFNANFVGILPFLDIIDHCQPLNKITLVA